MTFQNDKSEAGATNNTDCYFYYYSSCNKGDSCPYRHEPAALGNETVCLYWAKRICSKPNCMYRHMDLKNKNRGRIKCFFENTPGGCKKVHCPFLHDNVMDQPRPEDIQKDPNLIMPVNVSFGDCERQDPLDRRIQENILGQLKIHRNFSNSSFVVSLQDGDSDSECQNSYRDRKLSGSSGAGPARASKNNWELQRLKQIQEEEGNILGYSFASDSEEENLEEYGILVRRSEDDAPKDKGRSSPPRPFPPPPPPMKSSSNSVEEKQNSAEEDYVPSVYTTDMSYPGVGDEGESFTVEYEDGDSFGYNHDSPGNHFEFSGLENRFAPQNNLPDSFNHRFGPMDNGVDQWDSNHDRNGNTNRPRDIRDRLSSGGSTQEFEHGNGNYSRDGIKVKSLSEIKRKKSSPLLPTPKMPPAANTSMPGKDNFCFGVRKPPSWNGRRKRSVSPDFRHSKKRFR